MKYTLIPIALCAFLWSSPGAAQTLAEYVRIALEQNQELRSVQVHSEAELARSRAMGAYPDPQLGLAWGAVPIETRLGAQTARFSLRQPIPWFGLTEAREQTAVHAARALQRRHEDLRRGLRLRVARVYYRLAALDLRLGVQRRQIQLLEDLRVLVLARFAAGDNHLVNTLRIDLALEQSSLALDLLAENRPAVEREMRRLLNDESAAALPARMPSGLDSLLFAARLTEIDVDTRLARHPLLRSYDERGAAAESLADQRRREGMPAISLGIDYSLIAERRDAAPVDNGADAIMPMLNMQIPLFRSRTDAGIDEAELLGRMHALERDDARLALRAQYDDARYRLTEAARSFALFSAQLDKYERICDLQTAAFRAAAGDFDELLDTRLQMLDLELRRIDMQRRFYAAQEELFYLLAQDAE